ncbi:sugar phosphate isomerase/epimerase [candidate division KSB1 bacterium]|nr:sugar phosphate isomerase/epimerase [candidate division KSB1 bacterium]
MSKLPVALQLYTIRDEMSKNFVGSMKKVAKMGYDGVELAGTGGLSAKELKSLLKDLNLIIVGSHIGYDALEKDMDEVIAYNLALGNPYIVCPGLPEKFRQNADGWRKAGEAFTQFASALKKHGLKFAYHNHAFEFESVAGTTGYNLLFDAADPELVKAEVDVYWVQYGGYDPVELIAKFVNRAPLLHIKEMAGDAERSMTEVGNGIIDFKGIFRAAEKAKSEAYIIEQDTCQRPTLESAKISLDKMREWGL